MDWQEFYLFCHDTLGYGDMMPQPHDEMCQFIASLFPDMTFPQSRPQQFGLFMVPRNCFKTWIAAIALPLFLLWKNPNLSILISAFRHDFSKESLATIKWHIERNEKFIDLCGDWKPKFKEAKWSEDSIVTITRTEVARDASIDTCGVDRSKVGAHPHVIICDDLHSEVNVKSALMRAKVLDHVINMYPMLQPGGTMLVIGTRWHTLDAYGKLLALDAKAVDEGQPPQYKTLIRSCYYDDEEGVKQLYFPTRLHQGFLDSVRYRVGDKKFALWYLNQPMDDSERIFDVSTIRRTSFNYFPDHPENGCPYLVFDGESVPVNLTMAWDPAGINPKDTSDFHGVTVVGCDENSRWLIPYAKPIKERPDKVLEELAAVILYFRHLDALIVESVGQSGTWAYLLQNYLQQKGIHCPPIVFYKPPPFTDKNARIQTLQPLFKDHQIVVSRQSRELIDQLDNFPQLDYDDLLDSLQMHRDYIVPFTWNPADVLFDPDDILELPPGVTDERKSRGAYAGAAATMWASQLARRTNNNLRDTYISRDGLRSDW